MSSLLLMMPLLYNQHTTPRKEKYNENNDIAERKKSIESYSIFLYTFFGGATYNIHTDIYNIYLKKNISAY